MTDMTWKPPIGGHRPSGHVYGLMEHYVLKSKVRNSRVGGRRIPCLMAKHGWEKAENPDSWKLSLAHPADPPDFRGRSHRIRPPCQHPAGL